MIITKEAWELAKKLCADRGLSERRNMKRLVVESQQILDDKEDARLDSLEDYSYSEEYSSIEDDEAINQYLEKREWEYFHNE